MASVSVHGRENYESYARGTSLLNVGSVLRAVAHELLALARAASWAVAWLALHLRRAPAAPGLFTAVTPARVLTV